MIHKDRNSHGSSEDVLVLDRYKLSLISSALILVLFFVFIAGYFWGKQRAVSQLVNQATYNSFADQAYGASILHSSTCADEVSCNEQSSDAVEKPQSSSDHKESNVIEVHDGPEYFAQLAGFGNQVNAQRLVDRLEKKGISTKVVTRSSKTPRGKVTMWYQVVTQRYSDRDALQKDVRTISRLEKIKNVHIVIAQNKQEKSSS